MKGSGPCRWLCLSFDRYTPCFSCRAMPLAGGPCSAKILCNWAISFWRQILLSFLRVDHFLHLDHLVHKLLNKSLHQIRCNDYWLGPVPCRHMITWKVFFRTQAIGYGLNHGDLLSSVQIFYAWNQLYGIVSRHSCADQSFSTRGWKTKIRVKLLRSRTHDNNDIRRKISMRGKPTEKEGGISLWRS